MKKLIAVLSFCLGILAPMVAHSAPAGSSATVMLTPNPTTVGQAVEATGCGYYPNAWVKIELHVGGILYYWPKSDAAGCFTQTLHYIPASGEYPVRVFQATNPKRANYTRQDRLLAETVLQVQ